MKKLILLLILVAVSFAGDFFKGMENPNGKPFTLSIRTTIIGYEYQEYNNTMYSAYPSVVKHFFFGNGVSDNSKNDTRLHLGFSMPIASMLTIYGNISSQKYEDRTYQSSSLSMTCHLPLYKMWE